MHDKPISLDEWNNVLWPKVFKKRLPKYLRTHEQSMKFFKQLQEAEHERSSQKP